VPITVCSSVDGATCNGGNDWSGGWVVRNDAGAVIRTWPERSGGAGIVTGNVSQVRFLARGSLAGGAAPLVQVRLPDCTGDQGRNVAVNVAGRISVNRVGC
jgi:type IV fimbrial biogenesis protein FimT